MWVTLSQSGIICIFSVRTNCRSSSSTGNGDSAKFQNLKMVTEIIRQSRKTGSLRRRRKKSNLGELIFSDFTKKTIHQVSGLKEVRQLFHKKKKCSKQIFFLSEKWGKREGSLFRYVIFLP